MVDLLGHLPNRGLRGNRSGQGQLLVRIVVPRARDRDGREEPSNLVVSDVQGDTATPTPHLSRYPDSETAYGRLGLVHSILRIHLLYQPWSLRRHDTYSLITSSWHSLPKVDHFVPMASILIAEADQHEPSLCFSSCPEYMAYTSNSRMISIDRPHTEG